MKKYRKIISGVSALIMSISVLPMSVMAENVPETVMYENDFNASTIYEALATYENEYLKFLGFTAKEDGTYEDNIEGDNPKLIDGGIGDNFGNGINGRTLLFDFTKGGTKDGIKNSVVKVSYDVALRGGGVDDTYSQTYTGYNMSAFSEGRRMVYFDATGWDAKEYVTAWPTTPTHFVDTNIHRYEKIIDFPNNKAYLYVDGELEHTWANVAGDKTMNNYSIALNGDIRVLDNIKISTLNADSTYSFTADAEYANGYVDVVFPTAMDVTKGTFKVDGEAAKSVDWLNLNTARVYSDVLYNGGTYSILVEGAADLYGVAPKNNEISVTTEELLPEEVLYYNTFDNGAESVDWSTWKDYGAFEGLLKKKTNAINAPITATLDGNTGLRGKAGQWPTATQICFDFTKSGTKDSISTGTYKFSWDFSLGGNTDNCDNNFIGINMTSYYEGQMLIQYRADKLYLLEGGKWGTGLQELDKDKVHSIDVIIDLDADLVYFYINGELKYTRNYFSPTMSTFDINFCQCMDFFDNLKVSKINKGMNYSYAATTDTTLANGYVDVTFPAWMNTTSGAFAIDSETADSFKWLSANKVRVYSETLKNAGEHSVMFAGVEDNYGVAPRVSALTFNTVTWDNEYVLYESTFDNGSSDLYWTEESPAFTGGYNATKAEGAKYPVGGLKPANALFGGNMGIGYHDGAWPTGTTLWFDFTKGGTQAAPTSGKMKFSFDFVMQKTTEPEGSSFIKNSANNASTSSWSGGGFIYKNETPYIVTWDGSGSNYITNTDVDKFGTALDYEVHTLDIIIEHGGYAYLNYYLDGEKMPNRFNYWTGAKSFGFAMSGALKYVDNVKLSYIKDGSFGVEGLKAPKAGDATLTLYTTEQPAVVSAADLTVTKNGEMVTPANVLVKTIPASLDNNTRYAVEITLPEAVEVDAEYSVTLADTVSSVMGYAINENHNTASAKAEEVATETSLAIEGDVVKAVVVNDGSEAISPIMMIAQYDEEGRFVEARAYKGYEIGGFGAKTIGAGEVAEMKYDLSAFNNDVKVMLINGYADLNPIVEAVNK